jgi:hypothetical protein
MKTHSAPAPIELAPGDVAMIVREDGTSELFLPHDTDRQLPVSQFMLLQFATSFDDERVKHLLYTILQERSMGIGIADEADEE